MPDIQLLSAVHNAAHVSFDISDAKTPVASVTELGSPQSDIEPDLTAEHRATHSGLLTSLYGTGRPAVPSVGSALEAWGPLLGSHGGIIIPTGRDPASARDGLLTVAHVAASHKAPLVILQSHDARAATISQDIKDILGNSTPLCQIDMDQVHPSWQPSLETSTDKLTEAHKASDLARKRTLAQMLATRLGWKFVLFVDDDITPAPDGSPTFSPKHLAYALRAMHDDSELQLVGWPSVHFSDNSVVGHARPLVGLPQDVFVSGSCMLMRISEHMGFFPLSMFNEDWLMMIQTVANAPNYRRALAYGGSVRQKPYEPFDLRKAHYEEAGELLGEGLMNLLEDEGPKFFNLMGSQFWKRVINTRKELLHHIIRERAGRLLLWKKGENELSDDPVVQCMNVAIWAQDAITPQDLAAYADKWTRDGERWRKVLRSLANEAVSEVTSTSVESIQRLLKEPRVESPLL